MDVQELDLEQIKKKVAERWGWNKEKTDKISEEYRKFLLLFVLNPKRYFSPWQVEEEDDLDKFWHEHILHTRKYEKDCRELLGFFLHHDPGEKNSPEQKKTDEVTRIALNEVFGDGF